MLFLLAPKIVRNIGAGVLVFVDLLVTAQDRSGFRVYSFQESLGFRVKGLEFRVLELRVKGLEFRVQGFREVWSLGLRV